MRLLLGFLAVLGLAACGGGGAKADLPAGQHDLGDGTSIAIVRTVDPVPDNPAIDEGPGRHVAYELEWFNRTDKAIDMTASHAVFVINADGGRATYTVTQDAYTDRPPVLPPHSSIRGWMEYDSGSSRPAKVLAYGRTDGKPTIINL